MAGLAELTAPCIDRICTTPEGNVHYRGFSCHRPGPELALAKLSWSSSRAQCVLTVMYGVEVVDSFLQSCNRSSHDEVHINYFKVE